MVHISALKLYDFTLIDPLVEFTKVSESNSSNLSNSNFQSNCICKDKCPILGCVDSAVSHQLVCTSFS
jgi:hypothetical protein